MAAKKLRNLENLKLMTMAEVCQRTTYHRKTLERFIREGKLKTVKINGKRLVIETDFVAFIQSS